MIVVYVGLSRCKQAVRIADAASNMLVFGFLAGLIGGATNVISPLLMVSLLTVSRSQNEIAQAADLCFLIGKLAQILVLRPQFLLLK